MKSKEWSVASEMALRAQVDDDGYREKWRMGEGEIQAICDQNMELRIPTAAGEHDGAPGGVGIEVKGAGMANCGGGAGA